MTSHPRVSAARMIVNEEHGRVRRIVPTPFAIAYAVVGSVACHTMAAAVLHKCKRLILGNGRGNHLVHRCRKTSIAEASCGRRVRLTRVRQGS